MYDPPIEIPGSSEFGMMEDEIERLKSENTRLRRERDALAAENARLRELLSDVWIGSTIEFDDKRIDYVVVQMTRSVYIDLCNEVRRKSPH